MPSPLVITGYDPVQLDGSIDSLTQLQLRHGSNGLSSYGQSLEAEHDDLESPEATIRVKMPDFTYNGDSWEVTVSHQSGGNTISWSRDTDHAYRDLAAMTDALEVDVVAYARGEDEGRRLVLLGEAKWGRRLDVTDLARLRRARTLLADSGLLVGAETYARNLEDAVAAGVFGSPFYIVTDTGQKFWGQDRLDFLAAHLASL